MSKVYSGFNSSNYIQLAKTMNLSSTDEWELRFKLKTSSSVTNQKFFSFGTSNNKGILCYIYSSTRIYFTISFNGSSWNYDTSLTYNFNPNTIYWIKYSRKLNNSDNKYYYYIDISTDGESYENVYTVQNNNQMYTLNQPIFLGTRGSDKSQYWQGSIYECQIIINNQEWFNLQDDNYNGYFNTGCFISKDEGWTNFAATNSSYLRTVNNFNPGTSSWEIYTSFVTGTNISSENEFLCNDHSINGADLFAFGIKNNRLYYCLSSNGSTWDIATSVSGPTPILSNTKYYFKAIYDSTNSLFKSYISTDGVNYFEDYSVSGTLYSTFDDMIRWGLAPGGGYPFLGSVSVKQTKIYIDNTLWFDGSTAVEDTDYLIVGTPMYISKPNIAYKFNSSNYLRFNPIEKNSNNQRFVGITRVYFVQTTQPQDIITRSSGADRCWCMQASNSSNANRLDFYNGSSHMSKTTFQTNNWYWVAFTWDSKTYRFYSMLDVGRYTSYKELPYFDDPIWTLETSYNDTNNLYETGFVMGYNVPVANSNRYWRGAIDLNNCVFGNNIINYDVGKEGYITQSNCKIIDQNTIDNITLVQGIKLTINPDQADTKVIMWADGFKQTKNTNTLTAVEGTKIYYEIYKTGYTSVSDSYILGDSDYTINVTMEEAHDWIQPQIYDFGTWGAENTLSVKTDNGYLNSDYYLWKAFNEDNNSGWHSSGTRTPYSIYMSLGQPVYVSKMSFINRTDDPNSPWPARGGYLYGSNDGVNFSTVIATWTNDSALSAGQSWEFNVDNTQSWKYLKLYITNGSSYCCLKRIYIKGEI